VKLLPRIRRLEARAPRYRSRIVLLWVGEDGHTTKAADTDPQLLDPCLYDAYLQTYQPGGGIGTDAAQAS
jgi:hypothetical protein